MSSSSEPVRIFIGYDHAEAVAWNVFSHSIQRRAGRAPVLIAPVMLSQLKGVHDRPWDKKQSNEFAFTRWLVPWICNYEGWAIFADCDMLCRTDIHELWDLRDERYAVMCVKHNHRPAENTKYLNRPQSAYSKKNWSSVMLINCARCFALSPEYVGTAHGLDLHQFKWLESDELIGELPQEWNHLVGVKEPNDEAKIVHWTLGGPYFHDYAQAEFAGEWWREYSDMIHCQQNTVSVGGPSNG